MNTQSLMTPTVLVAATMHANAAVPASQPQGPLTTFNGRPALECWWKQWEKNLSCVSPSPRAM